MKWRRYRHKGFPLCGVNRLSELRWPPAADTSSSCLSSLVSKRANVCHHSFLPDLSVVLSVWLPAALCAAAEDDLSELSGGSSGHVCSAWHRQLIWKEGEPYIIMFNGEGATWKVWMTNMLDSRDQLWDHTSSLSHIFSVCVCFVSALWPWNKLVWLLVYKCRDQLIRNRELLHESEIQPLQ